MIKWFSCLTLVSLLISYPFEVSAHPHAWIKVRTVILVNDQNEVVALREHWLFDKMYSTYAIRDFNPNKKKEFSESDLLPLAVENVANLKEYNYFTVIEDKEGGVLSFTTATNIKSQFESLPSSPEKLYSQRGVNRNHDNNKDVKQISLEFTIVLNKPYSLKEGSLIYRIYDPTYYVDMTHYEMNPITVQNARNGSLSLNCTTKVEIPQVSQALIYDAAALDRNAKSPKDLGYYFSEKATVTCHH